MSDVGGLRRATKYISPSVFVHVRVHVCAFPSGVSPGVKTPDSRLSSHSGGRHTALDSPLITRRSQWEARVCVQGR